MMIDTPFTPYPGVLVRMMLNPDDTVEFGLVSEADGQAIASDHPDWSAMVATFESSIADYAAPMTDRILAAMPHEPRYVAPRAALKRWQD